MKIDLSLEQLCFLDLDMQSALEYYVQLRAEPEEEPGDYAMIEAQIEDIRDIRRKIDKAIK